MIVEMKKLTLLLYYRERSAFLQALQDEGFVHIVEQEHKDTGCLRELETEIKESGRVLAEIERLKKQSRPPDAQKRTRDTLQLVKEFLALRHRHDSLAGELKSLERDEQTLAPFGDADPVLMKKLADAGVPVRLCSAKKEEFERLAGSGLLVVEASRTKSQVFFALIGASLPAESAAAEIQAPEHSLSSIAARRQALKGLLDELEEKLLAFTRYSGYLSLVLSGKKDQLAFQSAGLDFQSAAEGKVLALSGFFPARREERLRSVLEPFTVWFVIDDPLPEDEVPVQLQNSAFARLFEPITRLYMLPRYREMDPTPILAPFFTLFVGLCLGDVAYGAIIMALSAIAWYRLDGEKKSYAMMGLVLGGMTVVCGFILNSCFGNPLCAGPGIPEETAFFSSGGKYCLLSPYKNEQGITEFPAMSFSLLLGFIQILVALAVQTVVRVRQGGFVFGLMPVSYGMMLIGALIWGAHSNAFNLGIADFSIGSLKLGSVLLAAPLMAGKGLLLGGLGVLIFFNNPGKKLFVRPLLGLWELYNYATGILGDMLSYIRLFALGLCSGLLGSTFNSMALGFITRDDAVRVVFPGIVATVLLLVGGHALNFILSIVGAFVHPIRLTFVEFFKNLGFEWGGRPFAPFCRILPKDMKQE